MSAPETDLADTANSLSVFFTTQRRYSLMYEAYIARGFNQTVDFQDKENRLASPWERDHYFQVGSDALRVIVTALIAAAREIPTTILDFPCGSGRVTRHLQSYFKDSVIVASDLYSDHVKFCVDQLGVEGFLSKEDLDQIDFGRRFDLIFCGSLLTHLPAELCRSAMRLIERSLSDRGLAIVTLHGRHSEYIQRTKWRYVEDDLFQEITRTLGTEGFGYVGYPASIRSTFNEQATYGISLMRPHWAVRCVEGNDQIRLLGYIERGWDEHQDVLVFGKPPINE
jgi:SAM-dependent methyltransferase